MIIHEREDGSISIQSENKDASDIELEEFRLEKAKREETDRKLAFLAKELGITL